VLRRGSGGPLACECVGTAGNALPIAFPDLLGSRRTYICAGQRVGRPTRTASPRRRTKDKEAELKLQSAVELYVGPLLFGIARYVTFLVPGSTKVSEVCG